MAQTASAADADERLEALAAMIKQIVPEWTPEFRWDYARNYVLARAHAHSYAPAHPYDHARDYAHACDYAHARAHLYARDHARSIAHAHAHAAPEQQQQIDGAYALLYG